MRSYTRLNPRLTLFNHYKAGTQRRFFFINFIEVRILKVKGLVVDFARNCIDSLNKEKKAAWWREVFEHEAELL